MKPLHLLIVLALLLAGVDYLSVDNLQQQDFRAELYFCVALVGVMAFYEQSTSLRFSSAMLVVFILFEEGLFHQVYQLYGESRFLSELAAFGSFVIIDLILFLAFRNRWSLMLYISKLGRASNTKLNKCGPHFSDAPLVAIFFVSLIFSVLTFIESLLYNSEYLGLSQDFAAYFSSADIFYSSINYVRAIALGLAFAVVIYSTIHEKRARSVSVVQS